MGSVFRSFTAKNSKSAVFVFVFAVLFSGFLISIHYTTSQFYQNGRRSLVRHQNTNFNINPNCNCKSEKSGRVYDFCYTDPQNYSSVGMKFDCVHVDTLERLGILNYREPLPTVSELIKNEEEIVFVSTSSDDHYQHSSKSYESVRKYYPNHKYILYGLHMSPDYIKRLPKDTNFEFRQFNTAQYPEYVSQWLQYRFKPLIMAEVSKEFPNVWWIDAHVEMKQPNVIKRFFDEVATNRSSDDFFSITSFLDTGHSNFATLFPGLLKMTEQVCAGIIHIPRTEHTLQIFKWYVLCALDEECMNPPGAQIYCKFGPNRYDYFANCFRFDQSVLNLLLLNQFQDPHKYLSELGEMFGRM
ncbi:hypothetical protein GCK72_019948 [Caenorhabditis remanei]|uniref:Uncharacterized protein n=1 Tax=Caenorhabditis remanei TaxID=31234 RepID=A0A6A5GFP2_CAERE|nr:hypothetical protein GCK72_019948 [Caenorhabditis remanei]KAF1753391.1 hypothetical protein GCK72_019948 [Caenorhabditis remanei]